MEKARGRDTNPGAEMGFENERFLVGDVRGSDNGSGVLARAGDPEAVDGRLEVAFKVDTESDVPEEVDGRLEGVDLPEANGARNREGDGVIGEGGSEEVSDSCTFVVEAEK